MRSPTLHLTIAVIALVGALSLYGTWFSALSKKSAAVAALEEQIATKTETATRIASARAALAEIAGDEATVRGYFVTDTQVVPFIDDLEERGRSQGTSVSVLSVANTPDAAHPSLTITLSVKGTFDAVMRTLGSIEYAPYALTFSSTAVVLDAKNAWHAEITLEVGSAPSSGGVQQGAPRTPSRPS